MSDYWGQDRFTQAEKKQEVIRDTFLNRAQADADLLNSGRFAKEVASNVVGAKALPSYPAQPATSPWGGDNPVPPGELDQVGYDLNELEPVLPTSSADQSIGSPGDAGTEPIAYTSVVGSTKSRPRKSSFRRF
jgi:hypothetical protein